MTIFVFLCGFVLGIFIHLAPDIVAFLRFNLRSLNERNQD